MTQHKRGIHPILPPTSPQISTDFVRNVGDAVSNGQQVRVRVLNVDQERGKFAVTMITEGAQAAAAAAAAAAEAEGGERPQLKQQARAAKASKPRGARAAAPVSAGDVIKGKVASVAGFGVFVEIAEGFTGLLHESEMVREEGAAMPAEGDELEVVVVSVKGDKVALSQRSAEELQQVGAGPCWVLGPCSSAGAARVAGTLQGRVSRLAEGPGLPPLAGQQPRSHAACRQRTGRLPKLYVGAAVYPPPCCSPSWLPSCVPTCPAGEGAAHCWPEGGL